MENILWLVIMIPCSALFTGIGLYAFRREKPMWFWAGTEVKESEIRDVRGYNRANGRMWIGFSLLMWLSAFAVFWGRMTAAMMLVISCLVGIPGLVIFYGRIYRKYRA